MKIYPDYDGSHECRKDLPYFSRGACIDSCWESSDGKLVVANGEYGSQVNFCPFCGYKAKVQVELI